MLRYFKSEVKTFLFVAFLAVVISVGGILILKSLGVPGGGLLVFECSQSKREIKASIENANYCNVDSDCVVSGIGTCPFGCFPLVNKNADMQTIQEKIRKYKTNCNTCIYGCIVPPEAEEIKCINNQCVDTRFQEEDNQQSTIDTSAWQTYRSEEFGFELRYPKDWQTKTSEGQVVSIENKGTGSTLSVAKNNNPESLTLDEWFRDATLVGGRPTIKAAAKPVIVNGIKAYRLDSELPPPALYFEIVAIADSKRNIFSIYGDYTTLEDANTLDQILATFRFVE